MTPLPSGHDACDLQRSAGRDDARLPGGRETGIISVDADSERRLRTQLLPDPGRA
ncbi:hypothetical protein T261_4234 [Streptomyces lydicus]|nr:hypothetical protein T261_4234 [Streptomyces lydicus]